MCLENDSLRLSAEEELAAEESLSIYCKPVEFYNILQRRYTRNPYFLQRCLSYKVHAKHKKKIQVAISLPSSMNGSIQNIFPLYILLTRLVSCIGVEGSCSSVYRFKKSQVLCNFFGTDGGTHAQAKFVLPELNKLALNAKSDVLNILFISYAGANFSICGTDSANINFENVPRCCLLGKLVLDPVGDSQGKEPKLSLRYWAELNLPVDMHSCLIKISSLDNGCLSVQPIPNYDTMMLQQLQFNVTVEEVGYNHRSLYHAFTGCNMSSISMPHIIRLRAGNVIFNFKYYNNKLQKTEVTEHFSCPFCLIKCASFKGLRCHLLSSHDIFNFEFWVSKEFQVVNVSVKADFLRSKIIIDSVDPRQQPFLYRSKRQILQKHRNLVQDMKNVLQFVSNLYAGTHDSHDKADGEQILPHCTSDSCGSAEHTSGVDGAIIPASTAKTCLDSESLKPVYTSTSPLMLQFGSIKKFSTEQYDLKHVLHQRQFYHSHRAQPMDIEQVLSDRDSEDDIDDDVADFEDRRMLDDFVDVSKDEKQLMHFWNSFIRKQRVIADGHVPWACEAFSRIHARDFVNSPALAWCWKLLMIKLWNHGLLDARTMNNCNIILEQHQEHESDSYPSNKI